MELYRCRRSNSYSRHDRSSHDHAVWIRIRDASEVCDVVLPPNLQRTRNFCRCAPRPDNTFPSNFETSVREKGRPERRAIAVKRDFFFSQSIRDYYLANCFRMEVWEARHDGWFLIHYCIYVCMMRKKSIGSILKNEKVQEKYSMKGIFNAVSLFLFYFYFWVDYIFQINVGLL